MLARRRPDRRVLGETPEVNELAKRLEETIASYRKVHEGLVARQAVLATDFSSSFAELEAEYTRLQSEDDVALEIGRILERVGLA